MTDAAVAHASPPRSSMARALVAFAVALLVAVVAAVTWNAGPKLAGPLPSVDVAGSAMQAVRGRAQVEGGSLVLDATGRDVAGLVVASHAPFPAAEFSRATWTFEVAAPPGVELAMIWRSRERPDRTFTQPLEDVRETASVDLRRHPDWTGTIQGLGLVVRGRLDAPLRVAGVSVRSNAWNATFADMLGQWAASPFSGQRTSIGQLSFESRFIAPPVVVVVVAIALAVAWLGYRAWRRKEAIGAVPIAILFLAGWLLLDLRWQAMLWREHAAALRQFAGKTLDEAHASMEDAAIHAVARRIRDADRTRPARILVVSGNEHLRMRLAWFLYPENVLAGSDLQWYRKAIGAGELRPGDQVVLLLTRAIAWDREKQALVWPDGTTRAAREILSDGPAFSFVEVTP